MTRKHPRQHSSLNIGACTYSWSNCIMSGSKSRNTRHEDVALKHKQAMDGVELKDAEIAFCSLGAGFSFKFGVMFGLPYLCCLLTTESSILCKRLRSLNHQKPVNSRCQVTPATRCWLLAPQVPFMPPELLNSGRMAKPADGERGSADMALKSIIVQKLFCRPSY